MSTRYRSTRAAGFGRALAALALAAMIAVVAPLHVWADDASAFRDLATSADYRVRVAAALALGKSKSPGARPALEKALSDKDASVRAAAAAALATLGDKKALGALNAALASETTVSVKAQIETSIKRLSAGAVQAKFIIGLGKVENKSGVSDASLVAALRTTARLRLAEVPGFEMIADGQDAAATGKSRNLPAFLLDASLTQLTQNKSATGVSVSAKIELVIRKVPDQTLKGTISGAAQAAADNAEIRGKTELVQLQLDAMAGAIDSAMKGAPKVFEAASR